MYSRPSPPASSPLVTIETKLNSKLFTPEMTSKNIITLKTSATIKAISHPERPYPGVAIEIAYKCLLYDLNYAISISIVFESFRISSNKQPIMSFCPRPDVFKSSESDRYSYTDRFLSSSSDGVDGRTLAAYSK